jgi:hypothetical protein
MKKKMICSALAIALGMTARADPPRATTRPEIEAVAYDIRSLLQRVDDYPLDSTLVPPTRLGLETHGGGGGIFGAAAGNTPTSNKTPIDAADQLVKLIEEVIDPSTWKDSGGQIGTLKILGGEMIVSQTAENQAAVASLLKQITEQGPTTIRLRMDWVTLDANQVDSILVPGDKSAATPEVSRDALNKFAKNHGAGQITCLSGQTVHLTSGPSQNIVMSATPVVGNGVVGYQSSTQLVQFGMAFQLTPLYSNHVATVDILSIASEPRHDTSAPSTQPSTDPLPYLGLNAIVQTFHTTLHLPINKPVLAGGMTFEPTISKASGPQLYLIIEADVGESK